MDYEIVIVAVVFALAGWVKGLSAMGLPTVAIGLLSIIISPAAAASLLVIPSLSKDAATEGNAR